MSDKQELGSSWWVLPLYSDEIRERIVIKSTSQTVWYRDVDWNGRDLGRVVRARKGNEWFPTKEAAIAERRQRLERKVQQANDTYSHAVKALKDFNAQFTTGDEPK